MTTTRSTSYRVSARVKGTLYNTGVGYSGPSGVGGGGEEWRETVQRNCEVSSGKNV